MARMHRRKRGRAASTRPVRENTPSWVPLSPEETIKKIVAYAKEGLSPSQIGLKLRDFDGVPNIKELTGKNLVTILEENELKPDLPENLMMLMTKAVKLNKHLVENRKDINNKRSLALIEAKIRRLVKYYKTTGELPETWKYTIGNAKLLVE